MDVRLCEDKVKFIIYNHERYDFPKFIEELRESWGRTRARTAEDTGIGVRNLFRLERGEFSIVPEDKVILLARYLRVPKAILIRKCKEYVAIKALNESRRHVVLRIDDEDSDRRGADQPMPSSVNEEIWKNASLRPPSKKEKRCTSCHLQPNKKSFF